MISGGARGTLSTRDYRDLHPIGNDPASVPEPRTWMRIGRSSQRRQWAATQGRPYTWPQARRLDWLLHAN